MWLAVFDPHRTYSGGRGCCCRFAIAQLVAKTSPLAQDLSRGRQVSTLTCCRIVRGDTGIPKTTIGTGGHLEVVLQHLQHGSERIDFTHLLLVAESKSTNIVAWFSWPK